MASILVLTPQVPYPPRQGTALRNWGLLQGLAADHQVSLLSFAASDQVLTLDPRLARCLARGAILRQPSRSTRDRLRDLFFTNRPDLAERLYSDAFAKRLRIWLTEMSFDWLLIEGLEMSPYLTFVSSESPVKIIFDDHNCEYLLQQRASRAGWTGSGWVRPRRWLGGVYSAVQWRRLRRYEAAVCQRADLVVAVSEADAEALRAIAPAVDPLVISNGIDVAAYGAFEKQALLAQPSFVFTGTMDFRPNVDAVLWFSEMVWPKVRAALPEAHYYVVGRNPHHRLNQLSELPGVVITGSVSDTRPYIRAATVYVVPLLVGGGTRLKLLESAAMRKAIVTTAMGAEGFREPERAMILADTPTAIADACITLARDPIAREAWGERAYAFAQAYDWNALLPPLLARLGP